MKTISIGKQKVGGKEPCYIIAEIGINHNGSLETARELVRSAKKAGADAAKFQAYKTSRLYSKKAGRLDWEGKGGKYSYDIFEANKRFEMPEDWVPELMGLCSKEGIAFLSSAWDEQSADALEKQGIKAFKIGSSSITNTLLVEHIAKKGKPVLISIGGATLGEVKEAVEAARKHNDQIALLHCHLKYPTPVEYANINVVETLKAEFPETVVGYSDHTLHPSEAPVAAVCKGAKIIEKHITLDKKMPGPDHFFALEPQELELMVRKIREAEERMQRGEAVEVKEELLGSAEIMTYDIEKYLRDFSYQTIMAVKSIRKGEKITKENAGILRPGKMKRGLEPKFFPEIIGRVAAKDIEEGDAIKMEDLQGEQ